jgi:YidC/Oxa1 family membrane protein insertase
LNLLFLEFLKPVGDALRYPFEIVLGILARGYNAFPPTHFIGPYGLAIITLTVFIKFLLFPLYQTQLKMAKKNQEEQRKVAPELAELRKKYKKDPAKLNSEMMALYKEHDIHPLSQLAGCLPLLAQFPVLIGLYQAIIDKAHFTSLHVSPIFVGLDLSIHATVANPVTWILAGLAGLTTFVQSRMMTPPKTNSDDPQAQQQQQISQTMSLIMPLAIVYFAFLPYALQGMVLYWVTSNIFSIVQQYLVNGWGQLPILGNRPPSDESGKKRDRDDRNDRNRDKAGPKQSTAGAADVVAAGSADIIGRRGLSQAQAELAGTTVGAARPRSRRRGRRRR